MRKTILMGLMAATMFSGAAANAASREGDRHQRSEARHDTRHHNKQQAKRHSAHWKVYNAPVRNWRYRPLNVGYQLQPSFYGSRYYVSDYNMYQLRAPGRYQRWIRYGDDLLLVNTRNGRVIQVVHNRYW
ncbi:MAG: RcnB family protein [Sphingomicrobium sp.]